MSFGQSLMYWAKRVKRDGLTLWFATKNPATPWYAKAIAVFAVAYALSPLDLIPDFIPVLGYLDDALLLPALIWLTVRLLPKEVLQDCRLQAEEWMQRLGKRPISQLGLVFVLLVWFFAFGTVFVWLA